MSRYKPYPKYKPSGVEWLGEVPEHWKSIKIKQVFLEKKKKSNPTLNSGSISFGRVVYKNDDSIPETTKASYQEVLSGEFLVNPLNLNFDLKSLRTALSDINVVVSTGYIVLQSKPEYDKHFLRWLLYEFDVAHMKTLGAGVRQTVSFNDIGNEYLYVPTSEEQTAIANFLDRETAKIDTLIGKQERLIELLQEKRQALISHAVTKGLDPNVKMKDSGVEWLGEVPEHWKIPKIKYFAVTDSGATPASTNRQEYYENGIYPWIRTTDLNNGELFSTPIKITQKAIKDTACNIVPEGSVLIGMYGGAGTIGKHSLLRFPSTINQAVCSITPNKEVVPEFLHYTIQFYRPYWMIGAMGTRKDPNIGQDTINNRHLPIPPIEEQHQIVAYLDTQTTKIDTLVEKAKQAIKLLKERRTALISAAVTGKIQVNDEVREDTLGCDVREKTT